METVGMLSFDKGRDSKARECVRCGQPFRLVKLFILRDDSSHAVCFAALHVHEGMREAWLDVILGTWGEDDATDHVTFGCRVGPVEDQDDPAATLVPAAIPYSDAPIFGRKLDRDEALAHPWLHEFWHVVDFVLVGDPEVEEHVYGGR
jgi:hypothetical protein